LKFDLPKNFPYSESMKIVNVVWLDTNECSLSGWQSKEELMDSKPCTVSSLGYLIKEDTDCITITADKDHYDEDDLYGRAQVIPKGVVIKIEILEAIKNPTPELLRQA
jgi:hypothetical protein